MAVSNIKTRVLYSAINYNYEKKQFHNFGNMVLPGMLFSRKWTSWTLVYACGIILLTCKHILLYQQL